MIGSYLWAIANRSMQDDVTRYYSEFSRAVFNDTILSHTAQDDVGRGDRGPKYKVTRPTQRSILVLRLHIRVVVFADRVDEGDTKICHIISLS